MRANEHEWRQHVVFVHMSCMLLLPLALKLNCCSASHLHSCKLSSTCSRLATTWKIQKVQLTSINMQTQNNAMPATVNLEVDMVAQRIGGATSTALTVPGDVRINTSGSSDGKEKKMESEHKRVRGIPPRAHTRTASEDSRDSTSSRRSVWSGLGVQLDSNETSASLFDLSPSPPQDGPSSVSSSR